MRHARMLRLKRHAWQKTVAFCCSSPANSHVRYPPGMRPAPFNKERSAAHFWQKSKSEAGNSEKRSSMGALAVAWDLHTRPCSISGATTVLADSGVRHGTERNHTGFLVSGCGHPRQWAKSRTSSRRTLWDHLFLSDHSMHRPVLAFQSGDTRRYTLCGVVRTVGESRREHKPPWHSVGIGSDRHDQHTVHHPDHGAARRLPYTIQQRTARSSSSCPTPPQR